MTACPGWLFCPDSPGRYRPCADCPGDPSTALAVITTDRCPDCDRHLRRRTVTEAALVRAGGYGGTRRTVTDFCPFCEWSLERIVDEVRP